MPAQGSALANFTGAHAIDCQDLWYSFTEHGESALSGTTLQLPKGARCLLVGANGGMYMSFEYIRATIRRSEGRECMEWERARGQCSVGMGGSCLLRGHQDAGRRTTAKREEEHYACAETLPCDVPLKLLAQEAVKQH
jgi:CCR4-NOT complex subunit CAF16